MRSLRDTDTTRRQGSVVLVQRPLIENDDGWDFKVLILGGEWVVRWPRHRLAVEEIEKEVELLPALGPLLPVMVPQFEYVSCEPWLVAYRLIEGRPLVDEDPEGVRAFLDALHGIDADAIPAPRPDWLETYREQAEEFRRLVLPLLDPHERAAGEALLAEVETLTGFASALTHSDLGPSHLLVHDGKLAGVIDWGDARIGDPALDYAWLLNGPFPDWEVDPELRRRALIYHRLAPWFEVHYGVFTDQPQWIESGLAGIRSRL
jgi:aminoglycoside phosphotransferase (APT) family kinase protein